MTTKTGTAEAVDVNELGRNLAKTTANLELFIAAEAQKRALKLGAQYAKAADERIQDNKADLQRAQDLVAELRRQMKPLTRDAYSYYALKQRVLELAKLAEDSGDVGPAGMLRTAVAEARASGCAKWEQEQADAARQVQLRAEIDLPNSAAQHTLPSNINPEGDHS